LRIRFSVFRSVDPRDHLGELSIGPHQMKQAFQIEAADIALIRASSRQPEVRFAAAHMELILERGGDPLATILIRVRFPPGGAFIGRGTEMAIVGIYVKY
jgi:hypothetical protein